MSSVSLVGSDASSSTGTLLASDELASATAAAAAAEAESEPALLLRSPLLSRYPSFVPLRRRATSIAEVVFLVPSATCPGRKASAAAAVFNMTATIVGGGVLSIPLSCARAGVVPFTLLMVMGAMATDLSLYLLVSCARRCGSTSFGRVCRRSFGPGMELASTAVVFVVVGFTIVGLMVLNMGIWSPLLFSGMSSLRDEPATGETTKLQDAAVLLALLGIMTHFLLKRDLTSLSHICYVGFASIAVLCVSMCYRAAERNLRHPGMFQQNVKWTADSFSDALSAAPIVLLAYLCSFNIIPVQCALVNPSRRRIKGVIRWAVFLSFALMYVFGIAGYLCAYDRTDGNILLNFDPKDPIILMGRVGCGITTLFALPTNLLPCREAFLSLLAQVGEARARRAGGSTNGERQKLLQRRSEGEADCEDPESAGRFKKLRAAKDRLEGGNARPNNAGYGADLDASVPQKKNGVATNAEKPTLSEGTVHWLATVGITLLCYVAAVLAPGVAVVWDISGSSMAFLVQFILPCACYIRLKLRSGRRKASRHLMLAWALLVFSIVVSIVCTAQTAWRLSRG